ncbi:MAG: TIGR02444 family protein [Pseudomonadota bacterium]
MGEATGTFWRWSLAFYEHPGVEGACLALQDEHNQSVNLVLFCLWLAQEGHLASGEAMSQAVAIDADMAAVIDPVRTARRRLKGIAANLQDVALEDVRSRLKMVELDLEQQSQHRLEGLISSARSLPTSSGLAVANVQALFDAVDAPADLVGSQPITTLLAALRTKPAPR